MSTAPAMDRKAVRKFFSFTANHDKLKRKGGSWLLIGMGMLVTFAAASAVHPRLTNARVLLLTAGAGVLVFAITHLLARLDVSSRRKRKAKNLAEFSKLADQTQAIQSEDVRKAFRRIFERSQIERSTLRVLEHSYTFSKERELFGEETIDETLGDLSNKSVRMFSRGDYTNQASRKIRLGEHGAEILVFNPIRLVALFLTETQLIICDVQIDSMDGDLKEEIQRISLKNIVNIHFTSERKRVMLSLAETVRQAEDLGYSEEVIAEIKKSMAKTGKGKEKAGDDADAEWAYEEMTSLLGITRTDGGALSVPIRSAVFFGKHKAALDQDMILNQDEVTVDRMTNELSRLVDR